WADEPTGNLDSQTADDILNLMQRLNREQKQTFVLVTHDAKIGALCDRIVRMKDGEIIDDGIPDNGIGYDTAATTDDDGRRTTDDARVVAV
ncbi:MAG: hypothetical protein KDD84_13005, partial [Caldilineaceae bacterium]|nr:hypothetical protein [Caldilineaceae bacterium]